MGVSCNVASAEAIFMYFLDRCEVCVCEGSLIVSAVAGFSEEPLISGEVCVYVCVCVCVGGGRGLRLCCLWIGFLYVAPSDG